MHVEVPPELSVGQAHERVTEFEKRLRSTIPGLKRVVTHIEPFHVHETAPLYSPDVHDLARGVLRIAKELYPHGGWHDLAIRPEADGGYAISMHCHVDPDIPLGEAHRLVEEVETSIKAIFASIHRMTIHTEPLDHD
jgi:divalent metal cation (Fe/Co/Zn/Cd) transporter